MTSIYLTDSDNEVIKHHEELYEKTSKHFQDKVRKECLWKRFASSCKLPVKVCKTWLKSQRTHYRKLIQSKSDQAPKEMTERQNWI